LRKKVINYKQPSFHVINSIGWAILILADTFIVSPKELLPNWYMLVTNTIEWLSGYLICIYVRSIYKRIDYHSKTILNLLLFIIFISLISSILFLFVSHLIYILFHYSILPKILKSVFSVYYISWRMTQLFPLMTSWSLLYFGIKFWMDLNTERARAEKADLLAQSAQLQLLRYQINPHFLFNTFSSLRALIRSDKEKAEKMVGKLSDFYRYTLVTKTNAKVPLADEIDAITHYSEIEKIRFEDKIDFRIEVDESTEEFLIPSFLIHPLVENAIKYGMKTSEMPLRVVVKSRCENQKIIIEVINSGKLIPVEMKDSSEGTGTGLANIRSRMEYSYPDNYQFSIVQENEFVKAKIEINCGDHYAF
jgi:two-component system, LytTR family, sensor kinase